MPRKKVKSALIAGILFTTQVQPVFAVEMVTEEQRATTNDITSTNEQELPEMVEQQESIHVVEEDRQDKSGNINNFQRDVSSDLDNSNEDTGINQEEAPTQVGTTHVPLPVVKGVDLKSVFAPAVGTGVLYLDNDHVLQMSSGKNQQGGIWSKNRIDLKKDFSITAYFYWGDQGALAADGMTFALQGYNNSFLPGAEGADLGLYNKDFQKYVAIEFDSFYNGEGRDEIGTQAGPENHIAFITGGTNYHHGYYQYDGNMSDGTWKKVNILYTYKGNNSGNLEWILSTEAGQEIARRSEEFNFDGTGENPWLDQSDVYWGFTASTGGNYQTNALSFSELPQRANIVSKDSVLYLGDEWVPESTYVSAQDENGHSVAFSDPRISYISTVDSSKPGQYTVEYTFSGELQEVKSTANVTVKEDKATINANDSIIYLGTIWNPRDNFTEATDIDGNPVIWGDIRLSENGSKVDTSKVGTTEVTYSIDDSAHPRHRKEKKVTVTVKEDKSTINAHDSTIYVGDSWKLADNFDSATDLDGQAISFEDNRIVKDSIVVDTTKSGVTEISYAFEDIGYLELRKEKKITVTVLEPKLELSMPEKVDFGRFKLGTANAKMVWPKTENVGISDDHNLGWDMRVKLASDDDSKKMKNFLYIKNEPFAEGEVSVATGKGTEDITSKLASEDGICLDYTNAKTIRTDSGILEWTLTPSTKEVSE